MLFQPGQYAAVGLRDRLRPTVMRCFSVTSSPNNQEVLQFSMRVTGRFTSAVGRLKQGDKVGVRGPFGAFVYQEYYHSDIVMFAGGIGVAPFISMIRYATERQAESKMHLVYSCRDQSEMAFVDELKQLEAKNPNLTVTYVIGDGNVAGLANACGGMVDKAMLESLDLRIKSQLYFVCGPPAYMRSVVDMLRSHGAPKGNVLTEAFSQDSHPQTGKLRSWPFNMYALTALSLIAFGAVIVAKDLYQTIPKLQQAADLTNSNANSTIQGGSNISESVNSVAPQVDTNTSQATTDTSTSSTSSTGTSSGSSSVTTSPTPTSTTTTTPRSTIS